MEKSTDDVLEKSNLNNNKGQLPGVVDGAVVVSPIYGPKKYESMFINTLFKNGAKILAVNLN